LVFLTGCSAAAGTGGGGAFTRQLRLLVEARRTLVEKRSAWSNRPGNGWSVDVRVVPEPTTVALTVFGTLFVAVGLGRWRGQKRCPQPVALAPAPTSER
jgi:hypothetical protein